MRNNPSENHLEGKVYDSRTGGIIHLPCFYDHRGSLCVAQSGSSLPFPAERVFWIFGVPSGRGRGGHAHRSQSQAIVAVHGSVTVILDNGESTCTFHLSSPEEALIVPPGIWNILENFSPEQYVL